MRYSIIARNLTTGQLEDEVKKVGGSNITITKLLGQVFSDLDESQVKKLSQLPGLKLKPIKEFKAHRVVAEVPAVETVADVFYVLRSMFTPPITGAGLTVAVLDSGVRKTHKSLLHKVIHEADFSGSGSTDDVYGHGTQVAYIASGGMHGIGEKAGVSPGASVMNIKVINDEGIGSDESIILGIDRVCDLAEAARTNGLWPTDEMYPNVINLSLGGEDDGDEDNPVRVACRQASEVYGLDVIAAAGNSGPRMTTVMLPACDPEVIAVGAIETNDELVVWEKSSRGPTVQGETKPDFVIWGANLEMASHRNDESFVTKSGTSFAAPMLSGLTGLLWESGRRAYGEGWMFRWIEARQFAPYFSTKPVDAPVKKDNAYGFGLPAMGAMLGQVARTSASADDMTSYMSMSMVMVMSMMAGITGGNQ